MLTTRPPRARHDGGTGSGLSALGAGLGSSFTSGVCSGVDALLQRSRLGSEEHVLRMAGVPLLMAAVVAGGPGWTTYLVEPGDTLSAIARRHGTDVHSLARLNGVGRPDDLLAGSRLTVPVPSSNPSSEARRRAHASGLHPVDHAGAPQVTYRVRAGDTVSEIALRAGTTERALLSANGLRSSALIRAGQVLKLPGIPAPASTGASATRNDQAGTRPARRGATRPVVHVVRDGDTLSELAQRYAVPLADLVRANRLTSGSVILPGQKLLLPGAHPPSTTAPDANGTGQQRTPSTAAHVVRRGETVSVIARRYGVGVSEVLALNHLAPRAVIMPGRRLLVPATRPAQRPQQQAKPSRPGEVGSTFLGRTYPDSVVAAANQNLRALRQRPAPSTAQVQTMITQVARRYAVEPALALAVAHMESGFDQHQVSPANAIGIMQVIPSSGAWASELSGRRLDLLDAQDNITAGVVLLKTLTHSATDVNQAVAGYYQGLASVRRHGMFADTRRYVATVRTLTQRFQ